MFPFFFVFFCKVDLVAYYIFYYYICHMNMMFLYNMFLDIFSFLQVQMTQVRMNMAYELFHSEHNSIKEEPAVSKLKRKRM
jgi:hypothetical protein